MRAPTLPRRGPTLPRRPAAGQRRATTGSAPAPRRAAAGFAAVLFAVLALVVATANVPYVLYAPGVAVDTLASVAGRQVVSVSGRPTYPTDGSLDLTTVSVTSAGARLSLVEALLGWVDPSREVLPRALVYPTTQSTDAARAEGQAQMTSSQEAAVLAAARELGLPVTVTTVVGEVTAGGPAAGRLVAGQRILTVDGRRVADSAAVAAAVRAHRPGTTVTLGVAPASGAPASGADAGAGTGGGTRTVTVRVGNPPAGSAVPAGSGYLGIALQQSERTVLDADIELGQSIGGPSAGLMFSLAIVDRLTPGTLPGRVHVAGTGTIDAGGTVGAIGGIRQKMLGARTAGATLFLAPAANCAEAAGRPVEGLRLVRVENLDGAVSALRAAAAGRTAEVPAC